MASGEIHFGAYGPFILGSQGKKVDADDLEKFWRDLARVKGTDGLRNAIGVYIAAIPIGASKQLRPVYIGKTDSGFKKRLSSRHSLFTLANETYTPRRLRIFFLARMKAEHGPFLRANKRPSGHKRVGLKSIKELEFLLIGKCVGARFELLNTQEKNFHEGLKVAGVFGKTSAGDEDAAATVSQMFRNTEILASPE